MVRIIDHILYICRTAGFETSPLPDFFPAARVRVENHCYDLFEFEIGNAFACTDIAPCRFRKGGMIFIVLETMLKPMTFL